MCRPCMRSSAGGSLQCKPHNGLKLPLAKTAACWRYSALRLPENAPRWSVGSQPALDAKVGNLGKEFRICRKVWLFRS